MKDLRQSQYTTNFGTIEMDRNKVKKQKYQKIGYDGPWYKIPKGWSFLYEKEHPTLSTGEAYRRLARKEYQKDNKKLAERYMLKARENGVLMRSNELFSKPLEEHISRGKSAVKGLKMPSMRLFRAVSSNSEKSEEKGNKNYEKMRRLGLIKSAENFKNREDDKTYEICIQRKTSDEKYGVDGSYIFASEFTNCPKNLILRHITDIYGHYRNDSSFERIYTIDVNGTINWYEKVQLEKMLENRVKEQEKFINQKAA